MVLRASDGVATDWRDRRRSAGPETVTRAHCRRRPRVFAALRAPESTGRDAVAPEEADQTLENFGLQKLGATAAQSTWSSKLSLRSASRSDLIEEIVRVFGSHEWG